MRVLRIRLQLLGCDQMVVLPCVTLCVGEWCRFVRRLQAAVERSQRGMAQHRQGQGKQPDKDATHHEHEVGSGDPADWFSKQSKQVSTWWLVMPGASLQEPTSPEPMVAGACCRTGIGQITKL